MGPCSTSQYTYWLSGDLIQKDHTRQLAINSITQAISGISCVGPPPTHNLQDQENTPTMRALPTSPQNHDDIPKTSQKPSTKTTNPQKHHSSRSPFFHRFLHSFPFFHPHYPLRLLNPKSTSTAKSFPPMQATCSGERPKRVSASASAKGFAGEVATKRRSA